MDIKEAWRWVLDWIYLIDVKIRNRAFVNMAMKFELLCDCQRVKKSSTPLIMFVTRHTILDLVNQKASPLNFVGQFTTTKTNCASIPVLFTVKITVFFVRIVHYMCGEKLSVHMLQQVVNIVTTQI